MELEPKVKNELKSSIIVTIDGPAASGKSSLSRELARRFQWSWVSTGAFYRGLAYIADHLKIDLKDENALANLALSDEWSVRLTMEQTCVLLRGQDVTEEIGREEVGSLASKVSSLAKVRNALLNAQRQCAVGVKGLIAEGRDCGTVVFPQAQVKIFLTARAEDRAARRAKDEGRDVDHLMNEQKKRDDQDANRKAAPLLAPAGAHVIDTTDLSLMEVVAQVEKLIKEHLSTH